MTDDTMPLEKGVYRRGSVSVSPLRQARLRLEISQEELADRAGMHRTYVGQVESAQRNVAIDNLEKLADAVGLPLWEMLKE